MDGLSNFSLSESSSHSAQFHYSIEKHITARDSHIFFLFTLSQLIFSINVQKASMQTMNTEKQEKIAEQKNKNKNKEKQKKQEKTTKQQTMNTKKAAKNTKKLSRYTEKTFQKFQKQAMSVKKKSAAEIVESNKTKKRKRKTTAKQKQKYEHVTKNVLMKNRLNEKKLLKLGNDTSLTIKKRWIIVSYVWSFKDVLFEEYYHLVLKEDNDDFIWSNKRVKSFDQFDFAFFRDRVRESNLFRAKAEIKKRRMRQLKQDKNFFTKKFRKTAKTFEDKKINEETRANLIYQFIACKIDKFMLRMKKVRLAVENKVVKLVRKQVASEIVNKEQFQLWLEFIRTFRTRIGDLKKENRSYRQENNIYKAHLEELGIDTAKLLRLTKIKKAAKSKSKGKKKIIIKADDHDSLSSETQDFDIALEN